MELERDAADARRVARGGDRGVRRVLDTSKVKRSLTITHVETIALVTPESGRASLVGANEVLRSAEGR